MPKGIKGFQPGHKHSDETKWKIGDRHRRPVYFNCDYCGGEAITKPSHYARKKRHYCSTPCYAKDREENWQPHEHNSWKGGIAKATQSGRGGKKYKQWQQTVFKRDGYVCVWCGSAEKLEADHIKRWSTHQELRYDVSNGRTLCMKCHNKTRNKKYYQNPELLK